MFWHPFSRFIKKLCWLNLSIVQVIHSVIKYLSKLLFSWCVFTFTDFVVVFTSAVCLPLSRKEWNELFQNSNYLAQVRQAGINGRLRSSRFRSVCWKVSHRHKTVVLNHLIIVLGSFITRLHIKNNSLQSNYISYSSFLLLLSHQIDCGVEKFGDCCSTLTVA